MTSKIAPVQLQSENQNCVVRLFKRTDLVECVTQRRDCQWALHVGHVSVMCKNPSAIQYVYSEKRRNLQTDTISTDMMSLLTSLHKFIVKKLKLACNYNLCIACKLSFKNQMNGFNSLHNSQGASDIETQIIRHGIALGINWDDEAEVQALAREALHLSREAFMKFSQHHEDCKLRAKMELFGLAALMMQIMKDSADEGIHTHGGVAWKSFSKALMHEAGSNWNQSV